MTWKPVHIPDSEESARFRQQFTKKARFLVDESLGSAVAGLLQRSGWNAKYLGDVGLAGRDDQDVLAFAHRDDRVLLTHDRDFLDDRRFPEHRNPGIVVLPGGSGNAIALIEALRWTLSIVGEFREVWRRSKVSVGLDGSFTVKSRNRKTGAMTSRRYCLAPDGGVSEWVENTL
jgi:predicted nuclease of predicted toxin-antitoxin system